MKHLAGGLSLIGALFFLLALHAEPPSSGPASHYADAPPPANTGGFGEPTCRQCHFGGELNAPGGTLTLIGIPDRYVAGEQYKISVRLTHPELERGGFELAARFREGTKAEIREGTKAEIREGTKAEIKEAPKAAPEAATKEGTKAGTQAGRFAVTDSARTDIAIQGGIQYAHQTLSGAEPTTADTASWTLTWTAPDSGAAPVVFHAAANAANDDASAFGDLIYTEEARSYAAP